MPRDRRGNFAPNIVLKHSRVLGKFGDTIIAPYSRGMSQRDIVRFMEESYGVAVDRDVISKATEALWAEVQPWQKRHLVTDVHPKKRVHSLYNQGSMGLNALATLMLERAEPLLRKSEQILTEQPYARQILELI